MRITVNWTQRAQSNKHEIDLRVSGAASLCNIPACPFHVILVANPEELLRVLCFAVCMFYSCKLCRANVRPHSTPHITATHETANGSQCKPKLPKSPSGWTAHDSARCLCRKIEMEWFACGLVIAYATLWEIPQPFWILSRACF